MLPQDSDDRVLTIPQAVAAYVGVFVAVVGGALLAQRWFRFDVRRGAALLLGVVYLFTASRRPWWLFYTMRNIRAFGWMDENLVRVLCIVIGCALFVAGVLWHPSPP